MSTLKGAVAVVTGAARGIGHAIAEELARGGASVVVDYAHSREAAEQLAAHLKEIGSPEAFAVQDDISTYAGAERLIAATVERFDRIDVLVNNAGINIDRTMKNLAPEEWDRVIQTDLSGYFYTVKAALPYFVRQESGTIVNISSVIGQSGNVGQTNYAAAKAGIVGFTKAAALELARYGITVNAICPGFIATEMYEHIPDAVKEKILTRIPLGRVGRPEEVARAVRYLVEDGDYITGAELNINGGMHM